MLLHGKGLACYGCLGSAFSFKVKGLRAAGSRVRKKGVANPRLALATPAKAGQANQLSLSGG